MSALSLRDVWMEYGQQVVLERINLDLAAGAFCALVGPSGCGKTTLLKLLLGQERPSRGRILLDDRPLPPDPGPDRGVVFQRYSTFAHLTALENVMLGLDLAGSPLLGRLFGAARRRAQLAARELLDAVGLLEAGDKYPAELSGGMQQRLAIAQALARRPRVLLLDEPFGALDPGVRTDMHQLILGLWRRHRMTVVMVTHDIQEGFRLATRVLAFDKVRHDPHAPGRYGATVVYDLPLARKEPLDAAPDLEPR